MDGKKWDKLNVLDQQIHRVIGSGMWENNETLLIIRMFGGFEFFNTRPYHNLETWSEGYEITSPLYPDIKVTAEDLDEAVKRFCECATPDKRLKHGKMV